MKDYYKILQVARTASTIEIKRSYRELVKLYHPDSNVCGQANLKQLSEVIEAYKVLGNLDNRLIYTNQLNSFLMDDDLFEKGLNSDDFFNSTAEANSIKIKKNLNSEDILKEIEFEERLERLRVVK